MIERQFPIDCRRVGGRHVIEQDRRRQAIQRRFGCRIGDDYRSLHRWQGAGNAAHRRQPVDRPAVVDIRGRSEQAFRFDLAEPVEQRRRAEVGRAGRPNRADGRAGECSNDGLRSVRQNAGHPVARTDACGIEIVRSPANRVPQCLPGDRFPIAAFVREFDRDPVGIVLEQGRREIQRCALEPRGARHPVGILENGVRRLQKRDFCVGRERRPERRRRFDTPPMEGCIVTVACCRRVDSREAGHVACRGARRRRAPDRRVRRPCGGSWLRWSFHRAAAGADSAARSGSSRHASMRCRVSR